MAMGAFSSLITDAADLRHSTTLPPDPPLSIPTTISATINAASYPLSGTLLMKVEPILWLTKLILHDPVP